VDILLASARRSPHTGEAISAPHQGLLSLAAVLREGTFHPTRGFAIHVIDDQLEYLKAPDAAPGAWLKEHNPDIIGVQTTTSSLKNGIALIAEARRRFPRILSVLGGVGSTPIADQLVTEGSADVVVRGEGEQSFSHLVFTYATNARHEFHNIPGITYRTDDGETVSCASGQPLSSLDSLPLPARDLVDMPAYLRISRGRCGNLITSRGCSYACAYCYSRHQWGVGQRRVSVMRATTEVEVLVGEYGLDRIRIEDDDFTENREWVVAFCQELIARRLNEKMEWEAKGRPEHIDEEFAKQLRNAGCMRLLTGIETLDPQLLRRMSRPIKVEVLERAIRVMHDTGIGVQATLILGIPGETDTAMRHTLSWLNERLDRPHDITSPCFFVPFYAEIASAMGRRLPFRVETEDTAYYTGHVPVTSSDACSIEELWTLYHDMTPTRRGAYDRVAHLAQTEEVHRRMAYHH
jgi:radical SAM superfamily enzyme YgiQ (UPF0313 family)